MTNIRVYNFHKNIQALFYVIPLYTREFDQALENINKIKNRKHKKLVQLLINDLKRLPKRKKIDKKQIDQMFREKQDLVLRAKKKNIELGKLLVNNYGP